MLKISRPWNGRERYLNVVHQNTLSAEQSYLAQYFSPVKVHLRRKMKKAAKELLTANQLEVFHLLLDDKQPSEIADKLGKSKSTIHATIYGSSNGRGGIVRKLQRNCS